MVFLKIYGFVAIVLACFVLSVVGVADTHHSVKYGPGSVWDHLSTGPWAPREGLMVARLKNDLILTGGRGTHGVGFSNEVWKSQNGTEWTQVTKHAPWGRRAYHILLETDDGCLTIMGGQTFTTFFNDVWKSCDGVTWSQLTPAAEWAPRAGLAATMHNGSMIVAGGCHQSGVHRLFWGDVWRSSDGKSWELMTTKAAWSARSGPRLTSFQSKLFLVAGERGFTPETQLGDVWSSADSGASWQLVTKAAQFGGRSGHGLIVHPSGNSMLVVAGWPELHDLWSSADGATWEEQETSVWGCGGAARNDTCGRFDFWSLVHNDRLLTIGGSGAYETFGHMYAETWSHPLA